MWKEAPDVKCIAVSATAGVVIQGPTPNNLLQDKLGEYRRVQLRVITERGVYEMVGMPNVMMWYAPGGTWNIGKRDELGQNRGWYQAVSKAISPEGITNWQVWDGANKKWEKAGELEAVSVGSKRIAFTGSTPKNVNADKLGEYQRKPATFCECRAVYDCVDLPGRSIWYATHAAIPHRHSPLMLSPPLSALTTRPRAPLPPLPGAGTRSRTGTSARRRTWARRRGGSAARTTLHAPS